MGLAVDALERLRGGITENGVNQTPLFGSWAGAVDNTDYAEAVECAAQRATLVAVGLDSFSPLEIFAIKIMGLQSAYRGCVK